MTVAMLDALISEYVAGDLPEPARVLIASHIEMKPSSAMMARTLEAFAGESLQAGKTRALAGGERCVDSIIRSSSPSLRVVQLREKHHVLPRALCDHLGYDLEDVPWKTKLPGLKQHMIEHDKDDGSEMSLLWARPGRALPNHTHEGLELTLVLDGDFHDHRGTFGRGDVSVADEDLDHRPVAGMTKPCLCLSVLFAPIVLSGSKMGLLGDILGL
ncbi:ChrR family anti-sigma-E factor [Rhizobium panacihumi]|uniref:ChrR family anti-sigma-E factor n=1 Tax=Rhizobium panacihumi TaxID=2008450 RepID=UPI003D7B1FD0